jgi:hypothetical protein
MKILYDPKCEELARFFLNDEATPGTEAEVQELAGHIQLAVESWIEARAAPLAQPAEPEDYSGQGDDQ